MLLYHCNLYCYINKYIFNKQHLKDGWATKNIVHPPFSDYIAKYFFKSTGSLFAHGFLPMMRMLMRKTMIKKIHMKNLSITLATFFHSAPFAQVALCSRKQLAIYSTLRTSLVSTPGMPLPWLQSTQGPKVTVGPWGGGFLSSGQQGNFWSSLQQSLVGILPLEPSYFPGAKLERWLLSSLMMWCCTFTLGCCCGFGVWGLGYLWFCRSSRLLWLPGFPFAWTWELLCCWWWRSSSWWEWGDEEEEEEEEAEAQFSPTS